MTIGSTHEKPHASIQNDIPDAYRGRTILITGGRGYIGSALTQTLAEADCRLTVLDHSRENTWKPEPQEAEVSIMRGDVSARTIWEAALPGVDYVFHLVAKEYFYRSGYDPEQDLHVNIMPILHLLEVCRTQNHRPRIVFASSANLFGLVDTLPVNEDVQADPLTLWAIHKLTAEYYLQLYFQQFGIGSISLRLANVYGPTASRSVMTRVVLNKVIAKALKGESLVTYANRECVRDYVFLEDVVQAFLLAGAHCGSNSRSFYVVGSGEGKTITDVWQLIADSVRSNTGKNVPVRFEPTIRIEPMELRNFVADISKFKDATGWRPRTGLVQGIDITVRAFLSDLGRFS